MCILHFMSFETKVKLCTQEIMLLTICYHTLLSHTLMLSHTLIIIVNKIKQSDKNASKI